MFISNDSNITNYTSSSSIVYSPYVNETAAYLSDAALCVQNNQLAVCNGFTPNTKIQSYPSGVFRGSGPPGVRFIPPAQFNAPAHGGLAIRHEDQLREELREGYSDAQCNVLKTFTAALVAGAGMSLVACVLMIIDLVGSAAAAYDSIAALRTALEDAATEGLEIACDAGPASCAVAIGALVAGTAGVLLDVTVDAATALGIAIADGAVTISACTAAGSISLVTFSTLLIGYLAFCPGGCSCGGKTINYTQLKKETVDALKKHNTPAREAWLTTLNSSQIQAEASKQFEKLVEDAVAAAEKKAAAAKKAKEAAAAAAANSACWPCQAPCATSKHFDSPSGCVGSNAAKKCWQDSLAGMNWRMRACPASPGCYTAAAGEQCVDSGGNVETCTYCPMIGGDMTKSGWMWVGGNSGSSCATVSCPGGPRCGCGGCGSKCAP